MTLEEHLYIKGFVKDIVKQVGPQGFGEIETKFLGYQTHIMMSMHGVMTNLGFEYPDRSEYYPIIPEDAFKDHDGMSQETIVITPVMKQNKRIVLRQSLKNCWYDDHIPQKTYASRVDDGGLFHQDVVKEWTTVPAHKTKTFSSAEFETTLMQYYTDIFKRIKTINEKRDN